jgi:hypothetical protein
MDDFFDRAGPISSTFDDSRRFPRFYFRSCAQATVHPLVARPGSEAKTHFLLTCDLSRNGLRILLNQQLFPGQRVDLMLNGQPPRSTEIVWCRRFDSERFLAGCRFVSAEEPAAM